MLKDIDSSCVNEPIKLYSDNQSAIKLAHSNNYHARSRHIDTKYNFIKEKIINKVIGLDYVSTKDMIANALTKAVSYEKNKFCNNSLGLIK